MANWNEEILADMEAVAAVAAVEVAAGVSYLTVSPANIGGGVGLVNIRAKTKADEALACRYLARVWIADAAYSEPDAQAGFGVGAGTVGEILHTIEANAAYEVISDSTGLIRLGINVAATKTVHVMAEINGRIYTGSATITGP